jgi:glycosyltransferase involved in cell wall biosynthesis
MRVALCIPALNEADSLPWVLGRVPVGVRVVVADNGSTDGTGDVARAHGADVVTEPRRGYGRAVQAAAALLETDPPDAIAIVDADGADDPALLPSLLGPLAAGAADLVLASRQPEPGALTPAQRFGNGLATALIAARTGRRYADLGPFRVLTWAAWKRLACADPTWGWNVEMQIKAARLGLATVEIPMPYRRRRAGTSKISGELRAATRAGARILWAVWRYG